MGRITFRLGDYHDIRDEYEDILEEYHDSDWTEAQDGNVYGVLRYRIVIPELHISLRDGEWYVEEDADDEDGEENDEPSYQCSVFLKYSESEKDINAYEWAVGAWLSDAIMQISYDCKLSFGEVADLECYIDFDY